MIEGMLKNFSDYLVDFVPHEKLTTFISALYLNIEQITDSCDSNPALMIDSSILRIHLDIFEALCKSKNLYQKFSSDLDAMLKILWDKILPMSLKDRPIKETMIDMLTGHYNATKSNAVKKRSYDSRLFGVPPAHYADLRPGPAQGT